MPQPAVVVALALSVASCDGRQQDEPPRPSSGTGSATKASEAAIRLARFKEREERVPCPIYGVSVDVPIEDYVVRFEPALVASPETRLPWIRNIEERTALGRRNTKALIVPYAVKSSAPIARSVPFGAVLVTRDGATHHGWPYNERLWTAANGRVAEVGRLAPDVWVASAHVFDIDAAQLESAVVNLNWVEYPRDRDGRTMRRLRAHAVIDLPPATPTDPIRGR